MNTGRELDALVAEKVMGWQLGSHNGCSNLSPSGSRWSRERDPLEGVPRYSNNITAAWEVVEKLPTIDDEETGSWGLNSSSFPFRLIKTETGWNAGWEGSYWATVYDADAETAPHAICLAALQAVGHPQHAPHA